MHDLALVELHSIRDQLTILKNVVAADRLDLIPQSTARIERSVERLTNLAQCFNPADESSRSSQ